jgi:hypothetical protein
VQLHGDQEQHPGQNKPENKERKKHLRFSKFNISLDFKWLRLDSVKKTCKQKHIEVCQK